MYGFKPHSHLLPAQAICCPFTELRIGGQGALSAAHFQCPCQAVSANASQAATAPTDPPVPMCVCAHKPVLCQCFQTEGLYTCTHTVDIYYTLAHRDVTKTVIDGIYRKYVSDSCLKQQSRPLRISGKIAHYYTQQ